MMIITLETILKLEGMLQGYGMLMDKILVMIYFRCVEDIESFLTCQESLNSESYARTYGLSKFAFISVIGPEDHL